MNITFLIGNGFDINIGLNTRYIDFYPYYLSKKHGDIISEAVANDYDHWADLELELGRLLRNVAPEQINEFLDSKAILESDLADYLRSEQQRIDVPSVTSQKEFQNNITAFYNEFSSKDKREFLQWSNHVGSSIIYQFISFNYTNVLDSIVELAKRNNQFGTHKTQYQTHYDTVGGIVHLHGTLSGDLILGLDNVKQIGNPELQASPELTNYIIKATINAALGEGKTERAKQLIDASDYVCVYGMSLGKTDLMWWKYLANWLNEKSVRRLILYVYEKATTNPSGPEKLRQQDKWKNTFLEIADAKPESLDKLRAQIIVILRSKIFYFSDIKLLQNEIKGEAVGV